MAKEHKSGLGRGLSNLLGNNIEEKEFINPLIHPTGENTIVKEVVSEDDYKIVSRETQKPTPATSKISERDNADSVIVFSSKEIEDKPQNSGVVSTFNNQDLEDNVTNDNEKEIELEDNSKLVELSIELVEPNPDQPRTNFDENKLQELAHSIKDQGVLQPIVVRKKGDRYQIIAGERRWQASRIAGVKTIPATVIEANDSKALELALIENIQRDDLNPIEEAYAYKRLMDKLNYTQAELAKAVAKGRSTVANAIRLLDLPEKAQEAMFNGLITAGHARAVLSVPSAKGRDKLTEKIIEEKLTVREAESLARLLSIAPASRAKASNTKNIPPAYSAMAKSLKEVLRTNVKVKKGKKDNKLEISFKTEEELRKIYDKLAEE